MQEKALFLHFGVNAVGVNLELEAGQPEGRRQRERQKRWDAVMKWERREEKWAEIKQS